MWSLFNTSGFGCVLLPRLSSYSFTYFTYCKAIALHNVSYKGHAQLDNVAFITHYNMLWHIVMDISNRLYVL
jgi:GT2 family glycosyltransferase